MDSHAEAVLNLCSRVPGIILQLNATGAMCPVKEVLSSWSY
jgi:hypothetical protein